MLIKVILTPEKERKEVELPKNTKIYDLVKKLNLNPDTVIVLRGDTPVPIDDVLAKEETLEIVRVISGG
ncbi:MAG: MoaD/ThiS family protein [Candidatus Thermoplasmatota archaeon]|nr:MoaD/ThiS family protein [Candidatus Thermoplasmatota archaeon]